MYRIMLADDEPEVLESMISNIDWAKYGFEPPVGCKDGQEAIDRLEQGYAPHALITDISMPLVDGLELTRYIKEHHEDTLVAILSGYDEFSYAQRALKMQVHDYLLKPVTPMRLMKLLEQMREELSRRQFSESDDALRVAASDFLNRLLAGEMDEEMVEENLRRYKLTWPGRHCLVAVLDVDAVAGAENTTVQDVKWMRYGLFNIAEELMRRQPGALAFMGNDGTTKLIAGGGTPEQADETAAKAVGLVAQAVRENMKLTVSAGIGAATSKLSLWQSHTSAQQALANRFYCGPGSLLRADSAETAPCGELDMPALEKSFLELLRGFDSAGAMALLEDMFGAMRARRLPVEKCVKLCHRMIFLLLHHVAEYVEPGEMQTLETAWEQHNLYRAGTIARMEALVKQYCEQVFELMALVCNDSASAQILKAEAYIKKNYANPKLSLQMLTDHLAVSTSYFSSIFKSRTGATFVEYLTRVRMDRARQILAHTDHRTYEVAEEVGFSDPHYFSVAFKRVTGKTPKEYREQCREAAPAG